jgi:uncharacterized sporulation protein YeaH/YhbH (DUF444 family)
MLHIIDRRFNSTNKSSVNRQRLMKRVQARIKEAVEEAVSKRAMNDLDRGGEISVPKADISEPVFRHGPGGQVTHVLPGNKKFQVGDKMMRPSGEGSGGSAGDGAGGDSQYDDEFKFQITRAEYLDYLFDGLELPYLVKKDLSKQEAPKYRNAGFTTQGSPEKLDVLRTLSRARGRRIALSATLKKRILELQLQLEQQNLEVEERLRMEAELKRLLNRKSSLPFLEVVDLRFHNITQVPNPVTNAVMFCIMDVSGSMTQAMKDMAKRYFLLLYLFLERQYGKTEIVFISHHTEAREVDDETFFYSRESGGTTVSSALQLALDIIQQRYPSHNWNIYAAQASDGDNWANDSAHCQKLINKLVPLCQYFTYIEIGDHTDKPLWLDYAPLAITHGDHFSMRSISSVKDIYPVFHDLFSRGKRA